MLSYDLIIIGAGPAGMTAAITASKKVKHILLIDHADKIGRKLLVTGNGRCNLTNDDQDLSCYRSDSRDRVKEVLAACDRSATDLFFQSLGIYTHSRDGYIYPYNDQAASVRDAFEVRITSDPHITVLTSLHVDAVRHDKKGYHVQAGRQRYHSVSLILTTGGYAGPKCGCDGSGYAFAEQLGHQLIPTYPALTALKSPAPFLKKISGVRNRAGITLVINGQASCRETGELQWTDYGISGVAIFQLSRYAILAMEQGHKVTLSLDLLPDLPEEACLELLDRYRQTCSYKNSRELLEGFLPAKLVPVLLREARVEADRAVGRLSQEDMKSINKAIKTFSLRIHGYMGYDKAQVTRGGVNLEEVSSSLESIYHEGLFFAGEILDVDGACGGYNLQWAFSSGHVAGEAAARYTERKRSL